MRYFRNPQIRRSIFIQSVVLFFMVFVAGLHNIAAGGFVLAAGILLIGFSIFERISYFKHIEQLCEKIDKILYEDEEMVISSFQEGELSILENQISKMVIRLREQAQCLKEDKLYLADSLADISHQIRTPLTSINLIVDFLKDPQLTKERKRELLHELTKLLKRIEWQINVLLKISKLDAGTISFQKELVNVKQLVEKAAASIAIPMEPRLQTFTLNADGTEHFSGDASWTLEAVINILKNCMEHTPQEGEITVTITENALFTEIQIEDNGSGMSKEDRKHIFDRFYKGKGSAKESVGIGMALAKMIITRQNGTIKADNRIEGGARFILRFYKESTI